MKQLVVTGAFPTFSTTFVTNEIYFASSGGFQVSVLSCKPGDSSGEKSLGDLGLEGKNIFYRSIETTCMISLDHRRFCKKIKQAANPKKYGIYLGEKRKNFFSEITRIKELEGIDIIHAHFVEWAYKVAYPLGRLLAVPFTFTVHDSHLAEYPSDMLVELQNHAKTVVLVSNEWKNLWVSKTKSEKNLRVVHNGVDVKQFCRKTFAENREIPKILVVSRLVSHKRVADSILAVGRLMESGTRCTLEIIGDGPEIRRLKSLAKELRIKNHVVFSGSVPHKDVSQKMAESDIFLHCSERESFGIVMVEAMASFLPVVAAKTSVAHEIVEDGVNGRLYSPGDIEKLVDHLHYFCTFPHKRREAGIRGREIAEKRFSWDSHMNQLMEIWKKAVVTKSA